MAWCKKGGVLMSKKKYGYIVDAISGEIRSPDIYSCKCGSLSIIDKLYNINNLKIKVISSNAFECSFCVYKDTDRKIDENFDNFSDMNAIYIDGFDYFDIKIDLEQSSDIVKKVTGKSLSYSELSNGLKVTMEINTESDMTRTDYDSSFPTLFYRSLDEYTKEEKEKAKKASLLHRLLTFAPHYQLGHIDGTLWNEFRTFSFHNQDFISVLSAIQEELKCLFELEIKRESDGTIKRYIHAYDLEYCQDCYHEANNEIIDNSMGSARAASENKINYHNTCNGVCLNNGTHKVCQYGQVTDIFISTENLTDSITLSSNKDSLKNMFQIKGGDEDITAAVKNINLSGDKIICFSQDMLNNMEEDLKEKVLAYQENISLYEKEYADLMNYIYNSYDVILYLQSGKVPYHEKEEKRTLENECLYIAQNILRPNAVSSQDPSQLTGISSKNIVKSVSGFYVGIGYTAKTFCISYDKNTFQWTGTITVTDSDDSNLYGIINFNENNTFINLYGYDSSGTPSTSPIKTIELNSVLFFSDDFKTYVEYKMQLASERYNVDEQEILLSDSEFEKKIEQSGLNKLNAYYSAFSAVMEVLQNTGIISSPKTPIDDYCKEKYDMCFNRCKTIEQKINIVNEQVDTLNNILEGTNLDLTYYHDKSIKYILGQIKNSIDVKDNNGNILIYYDKTQNIKYSDLIEIIIAGYNFYNPIIENKEFSFLKIKNEINKKTDIKTYLDNFYPLLCSYLKEDIYENSNYISDGLNNAEILQKAKKLLDAAKRELKNACELQYNISAPLSCIIAYITQSYQNIIIEDVYDNFILGNFMFFQIDNKIFKLRLSAIEFNYDSVEKITVEFTDVNMVKNGITDSIHGLVNKMSSIATSYNYTANQAEKSYQSYKEISSITKEGLDAALIHIKSGTNQSVVNDDKGILLRQYDDETSVYLPYQMRLNNGNIALTDNNWKSLNLAIGKGIYEDKIVYGVWADVLVGNMIVGEQLKISNKNGSVNLTGDGIEINNGKIHLSNDEYSIEIDPEHSSKNLFCIKDIKTNEIVMGIDTDGINRFKGHVYADKGTIGGFIIDDNSIYYKDESNYTNVTIDKGGFRTITSLNFCDSQNNNYNGLFGSEHTDGHIWNYVYLNLDPLEDSYTTRFSSTECEFDGSKLKFTGQLCNEDGLGNGEYETLYNLDCVAEKLEINLPIYSKKSAYFNDGLSLKGGINFDGSTNENSSGYTGTLGISYSGYNMIAFTPSMRGAIPVTNVGNNASTLTLFSCGDIRLAMLSGKMFAPSENNCINLGGSSYKWKDIYAVTGTIQTSDRNAKNSIEALEEDVISKFILGLKPVKYKLNESDSNRYHWGLISQDIEETMKELGMDSKDFAGFIKSPKSILNEDGTKEIVENEYTYSLRYDEFIAPMIKLIQSQQNRIEKLEKTVEQVNAKLTERQGSY